jgi:hypothetical protein
MHRASGPTRRCRLDGMRCFQSPRTLYRVDGMQAVSKPLKEIQFFWAVRIPKVMSTLGSITQVNTFASPFTISPYILAGLIYLVCSRVR